VLLLLDAVELLLWAELADILLLSPHPTPWRYILAGYGSSVPNSILGATVCVCFTF
jgi:hypothetical protein